jgi:hypothetical protein
VDSDLVALTIEYWTLIECEGSSCDFGFDASQRLCLGLLDSQSEFRIAFPKITE